MLRFTKERFILRVIWCGVMNDVCYRLSSCKGVKNSILNRIFCCFWRLPGSVFDLWVSFSSFFVGWLFVIFACMLKPLVFLFVLQKNFLIHQKTINCLRIFILIQKKEKLKDFHMASSSTLFLQGEVSFELELIVLKNQFHKETN